METVTDLRRCQCYQTVGRRYPWAGQMEAVVARAAAVAAGHSALD